MFLSSMEVEDIRNCSPTSTGRIDATPCLGRESGTDVGPAETGEPARLRPCAIPAHRLDASRTNTYLTVVYQHTPRYRKPAEAVSVQVAKGHPQPARLMTDKPNGRLFNYFASP